MNRARFIPSGILSSVFHPWNGVPCPGALSRRFAQVLFLSGLLAGTSPMSFAAAGDTIRVLTHSDVTVVTDPSKGFKTYRRWGVFPTADDPVRKVLLHVRFGCPETLRCADWDYLDHIFIRRKGGMSAPSLDYEIGRMLTPYGGAFGKSWEFGWTADVTDFSMLLRDSVEIEYYHSGYEPNNDRGWRVSVEFEFFGGPPAATPISVTKIYDGSFRYGDSSRSIEEDLTPVTVTAGVSTEQIRLIIFQTGHGMDDSGCGEFCNRERTVSFDGRVVDRTDIWRKCGDNPLYPQAGTWIFDRANWCPGYLQQPDAYEFNVAGGSVHIIDIDMEPYMIAEASANESVCAYVVEYGPCFAENDAAVEEIVVPTDLQEHRRLNPSCEGARIVVRNLGSRPLTSLEVEYGTQGFEPERMTWEGEIPSNGIAGIDLPGPIPSHDGMNIFSVRLMSPNGQEDAWTGDNSALSRFGSVPVHLSPLTLLLRTNAEPGQNSWVLRGPDEQTLYYRTGDSLRSDTTYLETFTLGPGCYEFSLTDTAGDGLEFWYNVRGGRGICRLLDGRGRMVRSFESDFGSGLRYSFTVTDDSAEASPVETGADIGLFPTRTTGSTTLDYFSNETDDVTVEIITDPGADVVEHHLYRGLAAGDFTYDLSYRPPQRYYLRVFIGEEMKFNKRIRVVDRVD